ncbi:hypothetical protein D3C81_198720 [compost metagenome]
MRKVLSRFFKSKKQSYNLVQTANSEKVLNDFRRALSERDRALRNFDYSDSNPDHVDAAIYDIKAAEIRLGIVLKEAKQLTM